MIMSTMDSNIMMITVFLLVHFIQANALQCWSCSSKTEGHQEFCGEKLLRHKIPEKLERTGLLTQNCSKFETLQHQNSDVLDNLIPVCRKKILKVNDEKIYQRHCDFIDKRARTECKEEKIAVNSEILHCNDCTSDYCNESVTIIPNLLSYMLPIILAKILLY